MKIVKVETIPVAYPYPNDSSAERYLCLVKITTDVGLCGWGESITSITVDPKRLIMNKRIIVFMEFGG